jgi:PhzF family phenazine biosynthesis protein
LLASAAYNTLPDPAFRVPSARDPADYDLRWFTPTVEVDLCGHATLAAGHVQMSGERIRFATRSGILTVARAGDLLELNLPAATLHEVDEPELCAALGLEPRPVWLADGFNDSAIVALENEAAVRSVEPDFAALKPIRRMAIVTAPGDEHDIASRVFVPYAGIDEDPVTGSAHGALVPFWAERLGRERLTALQASPRTGVLHCTLAGDRVILGGRCVTVIVGNYQL